MTPSASRGLLPIAANLLAVVLALIAPAASADARTDYLLHCGGCHLEDGSGDPPLVPSLRSNIDHFARSAAGRSYLAQVPGAAQVPISDARLAAVLNWVLTSYYPDQSFQPFDAEEVGGHRSHTLMDPLAVREGLLPASP